MRSITILATLASLANTVTSHAFVDNACGYTVNLHVESGTGISQSISLAAGQNWQRDWTVLSNNEGWTFSLSPASGSSNTLDFDYTDDGGTTIWWGLWCINGDPWSGNWELSTSANVAVHQTCGANDEDDQNGMQNTISPQDDAGITLCAKHS